MKNITISRIEPTNPMLTAYVKRIKSWDKEGKVQIEKDEKILPFYAIYLGDVFLAASTIEFDKEESLAKIAMINGSINHYNRIQMEATTKLYDLVNETYSPEKINFSYVKGA